MRTIIKLSNPDLSFNSGEHIAITGSNAAGKTKLVDSILDRNRSAGTTVKYDFTPSRHKYASEYIQYITFHDVYGDAGNSYYLQLRWNQMEIDEQTPVVGDLLDRVLERNACDRDFKEKLYDMFGMTPLLDKYIISLSSGELRKYQLVRALLSRPEVLILDNPFIGLDPGARDSLSDLLGSIARGSDIMIILVMSRFDTLPEFITHVIPVNADGVQPKVPVSEFRAADGCSPLPEDRRALLLSLPTKDLGASKFYPQTPGAEIIRMTDMRIRYGNRTILDGVNWTVHEGECWAVTGENGAGKSTLLSLVCADNPQSYACNIELFGHRRGRGESIWDIKKHIGYVSPESFRAYKKNIPAIDVVASGLFDTVGLYMHPTAEQYASSLLWMRIFDIAGIADRPFLSLSSGEQRLCLLARAFVKDPELLILDEPLHGIDAVRSAHIKEIINIFMTRPHKTLLMVSHYESELPICINHHIVLVKK